MKIKREDYKYILYKNNGVNYSLLWKLFSFNTRFSFLKNVYLCGVWIKTIVIRLIREQEREDNFQYFRIFFNILEIHIV